MVENFVEKNPGITVAFVCLLLLLVGELYRRIKALKVDRRAADREIFDAQVDKLGELVMSQSQQIQDTTSQLVGMSEEFRRSLEKTNTEFRSAIREVTTEFRTSVDSLHDKVNDVAKNHAALHSEHERMLKICPVAHGGPSNRSQDF